MREELLRNSPPLPNAPPRSTMPCVAKCVGAASLLALCASAAGLDDSACHLQHSAAWSERAAANSSMGSFSLSAAGRAYATMATDLVQVLDVARAAGVLQDPGVLQDSPPASVELPEVKWWHLILTKYTCALAYLQPKAITAGAVSALMLHGMIFKGGCQGRDAVRECARLISKIVEQIPLGLSSLAFEKAQCEEANVVANWDAVKAQGGPTTSESATEARRAFCVVNSREFAAGAGAITADSLNTWQVCDPANYPLKSGTGVLFCTISLGQTAVSAAMAFKDVFRFFGDTAASGFCLSPGKSDFIGRTSASKCSYDFMQGVKMGFSFASTALQTPDKCNDQATTDTFSGLRCAAGWTQLAAQLSRSLKTVLYELSECRELDREFGDAPLGLTPGVVRSIQSATGGGEDAGKDAPEEEVEAGDGDSATKEGEAEAGGEAAPQEEVKAGDGDSTPKEEDDEAGDDAPQAEVKEAGDALKEEDDGEGPQ
uniref:Uncharacterized protein n=1 Tax=Alexandrium catenella TaxID=2925 RepID=A0A7S1PQV7_ALECA